MASMLKLFFDSKGYGVEKNFYVLFGLPNLTINIHATLF